VLIELTFKVFPRPEACGSLEVSFPSLALAVAAAEKLLAASLDLAALDIEPRDGGVAVLVRIAGLEGQIAERLERLARFAGGGTALRGEPEAALWRAAAECAWARGGLLVRVAAALGRLEELDAAASALGLARRYSGGGSAAWLAAEAGRLPEVDAMVRRLGLRGLVARGPAGSPLLGAAVDEPFRRRVASVLDPAGRFAAY
jgi:hypothetical protein